MSYGAKTYKNTSITTATPEQVLLMLYEAAIKSLKLAKTAMEKKNIPEKCKHIKKATDIITELASTLDHKKGAQVAEQLESLYSFCTTELLKANINNDVASIESVTKIMTTLYEGWVIAVEEVMKQKKAAKQA